MSRWTVVIEGEGPSHNSFSRFPGESLEESDRRKNHALMHDADAIYHKMVNEFRRQGHVINHASITTGQVQAENAPT